MAFLGEEAKSSRKHESKQIKVEARQISLDERELKLNLKAQEAQKEA